MALPDPLFQQVVLQAGMLTPDLVAQLQARQRELAAAGQLMPLMEIAVTLGFMPPAWSRAFQIAQELGWTPPPSGFPPYPIHLFPSEPAPSAPPPTPAQSPTTGAEAGPSLAPPMPGPAASEPAQDPAGAPVSVAPAPAQTPGPAGGPPPPPAPLPDLGASGGPPPPPAPLPDLGASGLGGPPPPPASLPDRAGPAPGSSPSPSLPASPAPPGAAPAPQTPESSAPAPGVGSDARDQALAGASPSPGAVAAPGPARTPSGRVRTPSGRVRTPSGRVRTPSGRVRPPSGKGRVPSGRTRSGRLRSSGVRATYDLEEGQAPRRQGAGAGYLVLAGFGLFALLIAVAGATLLFTREPRPQVAAATPSATTSSPKVDPTSPDPAERYLRQAENEIAEAERDLARGRVEVARRRLQRLESSLRGEPAGAKARRLVRRHLAELPEPAPERVSPSPTSEGDVSEWLDPGSKKPRRKSPARRDPPPAGAAEDPLAPEPAEPEPAEPESVAAAPEAVEEEPRAPEVEESEAEAENPLAPEPEPAPAVAATPKPAASPAGGQTSGPAASGGSHLDSEFQAKRKKIRKGSKAREYLSLARWARSKGLYEEEKEALTLATEAEPDHKGARTKLRKVLEKEAYHRKFRTPWRREASVIFVETNTDEAKLHYYCDTVSAFYKRFSKIFRIRKNPVQAWGKKVGVKVFRTREDFDRYSRESGVDSSGAVGYYRLNVKEIVLYYDPNAPESTLDTLFHEGAHLFTHLVLGERFYALPHWMSEGIAEYFAPSKLDRKKKDLRYGLPAYDRLRYARRILNAQKPSLRGDLLAITDYSSFGAARYSLAYTLIHMLLEKPRRGSTKPKYRDRFLSYWAAVTKGHNSIESFERLIGPIDRIEEEWHEYIAEFPVPLIEEARDLMRKGDTKEAIPVLQRHIQAKPGDAQGHYLLGEAQLELEDYAAAEAAYAEAVRINPDFVDSLVGLAFAHSYQDEGAPAVAAAQRAVAISPNAVTYLALATAAVAAKDKPLGLKAIDAVIDRVGATRSLLEIKRQLNAL